MPMGDAPAIELRGRAGRRLLVAGGDVLLASKDVGGNEFFQLYTLADGQLRLITDGRSRNQFNALEP